MTIFKVNPVDISSFTIETGPKVEIKKVEDTKITLSGRRNFKSSTDINIRKSGEKKVPSGFTRDYLTSFIGLNKLKDSLLDIPPLEVSPKRLSGNTILSEPDVKKRYPDPDPEKNLEKLLPYYDEILQKKWMIQDLLNPFYGFSDDWHYEDFHFLNFFDWDNGDPIALLYPNIGGRYDITNNVTIKFWIRAKEFRDPPGTIIHIPNCLAVFLLSGEPANSFGLRVQFGDSANLEPDDDNTPDTKIIFNDCIKPNEWSYIELTLKQEEPVSLKVNSRQIEPLNNNISAPIKNSQYGIISVGSFCSLVVNTFENHKILFNSRAAQTRGVELFVGLDPNIGDKERPDGFNLKNQLVAQIYDLKILNVEEEIFYLRPSFSETSGNRKREYVRPLTGVTMPSNKTGVIRTPFYNSVYHTINGTTKTPFNTLLAFGAGGHLINIENFLSADSSGEKVRPRIFGFEQNNISYSVNSTNDCDKIIFNDTQFSKRNLFIIPCDNGDNKEIRNNKILLRDLKEKRENNDYNLTQDRLVELYGAIPIEGKFWWTGSLASGSSEPPTVLDTVSKDSSSNQYVLFEIPNLFFGKRIKPGTFSIKATIDKPIHPSKSGHFSFTLQDDGQGGLYPLNPNGNSAKWNIVGRVYYNEGLVLIKNPHLYFFGYNNDWEMTFKGEQNVYTLKIEAIASQSSLNYSRNKTFDESLSPSALPDDEDDDFVFISNINFHDKDLNVIAKTQLAQPFLKKSGDSVLFKVQMDF
jgi:hypothetical protein